MPRYSKQQKNFHKAVDLEKQGELEADLQLSQKVAAFDPLHEQA